MIIFRIIFFQAFPTKIFGNIVTSQIQKIAQVSEKYSKLQGDIESSETSIEEKHKNMMIKRKNSLLEEKKLLENAIR